MGDAIGLALVLPRWYLGAVLTPLSAGLLTFVPAVGTLCLVAGVAIGGLRREVRLLPFTLPFALTEVLAAVAGALRGRFRDHPTGGIVLLAFLVVQLLLPIYLAYSQKGARLPATLLAIFSVTYAAHGAFVAAMSFDDSWL